MAFTLDSIYSIVVNLGVAYKEKMPSNLNRAIHAQVLSWLQKGDPDIATLIHNSQRSPLSITELNRNKNHPLLKSDIDENSNRVFFRVNFLQGYLVPIFLKGIEQDRVISLGNHKFTLASVDSFPTNNSQAKSTTYGELFEPRDPYFEIKLKLLTPTSFKQNNCIQPFPLPELVFSNLLRRWNTFAPAEYQFPKIDWQGMTAAYDLKTKVIKKEVTEIGSIGWVKYEFKDEEQARVAITLANFANFSGIGRKTALGMGRTQFIPKDLISQISKK
jgi:CRISPR-associated endoribonuclease Cas6